MEKMFRKRPAKQLDSKSVQNSLRANILNLITEDLKAVACRAVWRVKNDDLELAKLQICSKRLEIDDALAKIDGVQFFFSCVTAISSNLKSASQNIEREEPIYPGVGYFIVYRKTEKCDENVLFSTMHNEDVDVTISPVKTRSKRAGNGTMENAARQLFQVVKDNGNQFVRDMCNLSNDTCYKHAQSSETSGKSSQASQPSQPSQSTRYPQTPCRLVIVNEAEFYVKLHAASAKLLRDGMRLEIDSLENFHLTTRALTSPSGLTETVEKIKKIMVLCNHGLHRGFIYAKPGGARITYVKMMDVDSYLNKLLSTDAIREQVLKHFRPLCNVLAHPACEIIPQIKFDLDLIEVSNGYCFRISKRQFERSPMTGEDLAVVSPRAYLPYDQSTPPDAGFFQHGILNSFADRKTRVNFLNKYYQCLMACRMPQKVRKLVVAGPKDSGKTAWASVFHRIIPTSNIASITGERHFSAAMITDETQLVIVDEWSVDTVGSDLAKTILQGGWMVTAVKHESPRCLRNNSPFFITTNVVPEFGSEDDNVKRRIAVFRTKSLPETITGADRWIFDHAMDCIVWAADEINENIALVDPDELWYENPNPHEDTIDNNEGISLFDSRRLRDITHADLAQDSSTSDQVTENDTVHNSFILQSRKKRLARKRRRRRNINELSSDDEENDARKDDDRGTVGEYSNNANDSDNAMLSTTLIETVLLNQPLSEDHLSDGLLQDAHSEKEANDTIPSIDHETRQLEQPSSSLVDHHQNCVNNEKASALENISDDNQSDDDTDCDAIENVDGLLPALPANTSMQPFTSSQLTADVHLQESQSEVQHDEEDVNDGMLPSTSKKTQQSPDLSVQEDNDKNDPIQHENEDDLSGPVITPSSWVLNSSLYLAKVCELLKYNFDNKNINGIPALSFISRRKNAHKKEKLFWQKAEPSLDAWMLVIGEVRDVFQLNVFARKYPDVYKYVQRVRKLVNVQVLPCSCPVFRELQRINKENLRAETDEESGEEEQVQVPTDTYWTVIKKWRPW